MDLRPLLNVGIAVDHFEDFDVVELRVVWELEWDVWRADDNLDDVKEMSLLL